MTQVAPGPAGEAVATGIVTATVAGVVSPQGRYEVTRKGLAPAAEDGCRSALLTR